MRNIFKDKNFPQIFLAIFFSLLVIFFIASIILWNNRGAVFSYFAKQYLNEMKVLDALGKGTGRSEFTEESFVVDAVKKANPGVVSIILSKDVPIYETYIEQRQRPLGNLFPGFNITYNVLQSRQSGTEKKDVGGGSGFFVSGDGLIVTNRHVVDQKNVEYTVFTNDGKKHPAKVTARDLVLDVALIKIDLPAQAGGSDYPYLELGDSDKLEVGQSVIAIGNALGEFRNTVSVGVVSGLARSITAGTGFGKSETLDKVIQTDAAINPGNSGGPLLDLSGRVIGVNVAVAQGSQSIGFALPINSIRRAIESVKATGKIVPVTPEATKNN
jgi:serine protease Do